VAVEGGPEGEQMRAEQPVEHREEKGESGEDDEDEWKAVQGSDVAVADGDVDEESDAPWPLPRSIATTIGARPIRGFFRAPSRRTPSSTDHRTSPMLSPL
jgi:hypothetical protein